MIDIPEFGADPQSIAAEVRSLARECWTAVLLSGLPSAGYRGLDSFIASIDQLCRERLAGRTKEVEPELELVL